MMNSNRESEISIPGGMEIVQGIIGNPENVGRQLDRIDAKNRGTSRFSYHYIKDPLVDHDRRAVILNSQSLEQFVIDNFPEEIPWDTAKINNLVQRCGATLEPFRDDSSKIYLPEGDTSLTYSTDDGLKVVWDDVVETSDLRFNPRLEGFWSWSSSTQSVKPHIRDLLVEVDGLLAKSIVLPENTIILPVPSWGLSKISGLGVELTHLALRCFHSEARAIIDPYMDYINSQLGPSR